MTIQEMYDMFLLEQEFRNNSPVTISWYKDQLEEFFIWLMDNIPKAYNDPAQLNLLNFKRYGVHLKQQTKRNGDRLSSSSVHGSLRAVKAFYNFCIGEDYLEDFSRQLRLPKFHCKEQLILDDQEINSLGVENALYTLYKVDEHLSILLTRKGSRNRQITLFISQRCIISIAKQICFVNTTYGSKT